jgi:Pirin C-terminal cupin domain
VEVSGITYYAGQMLVFRKKDAPLIRAKEQSTLMLLGGEPIGERFIWWNFVSSRKERIEQSLRRRLNKTFCKGKFAVMKQTFCDKPKYRFCIGKFLQLPEKCHQVILSNDNMKSMVFKCKAP